MASTGRRVFLSSGAPLTLRGMISTKGQSDQSGAAMFVPSFHHSLYHTYSSEGARPTIIRQLGGSRSSLCSLSHLTKRLSRCLTHGRVSVGSRFLKVRDGAGKVADRY